jgi:glycosyltransferase involved in cell wall biosynthesis
MKNILVIASNYMSLDISGNNRTNYIPQFLHNHGYNVELVTSNFNHHKKEKVIVKEKRDYKVTLLKEIGYKKNVSLKRVLSIIVYQFNLKNYLKHLSGFDYVYVFVPPHSVAHIARDFAKRINAKLIIDVRDLWPEAYKILFNNDVLYNLLFWPLLIHANITYKSTSLIFTVSKSYKQRIERVNNFSQVNILYLGTSLSEFDKFKNNDLIIKKDLDEFWLTYSGTLGNSYDIELLLKVYKLLLNDGFTKIKLLIVGSGPNIQKLKLLDKELNTSTLFFPRLEYPKMVPIICNSDILLNPLVKNASQSIINKHMDYAAAGIPVISTQLTKEYKDLLKNYNSGFSINRTDHNDFKNHILKLYFDKTLRLEMGRNHRKMAEELFDRDKTYKVLINTING